jgi:putative oxidoreductase
MGARDTNQTTRLTDTATMTLPTLLIAVRSSWSRVTATLDLLRPAVDLIVRLYLARVFVLSGLTKVADWGTTVALFTDEYQVPLLPPDWAAFAAASGELALPLLLVLGLATRFAACGLFVLNAVAVLSYWHVLKDSPAAWQAHLNWGLLLAFIAVSRVSPWTLDCWLNRRLQPGPVTIAGQNHDVVVARNPPPAD